jgi:hypothetical protein
VRKITPGMRLVQKLSSKEIQVSSASAVLLVCWFSFCCCELDFGFDICGLIYIFVSSLQDSVTLGLAYATKLCKDLKSGRWYSILRQQ